MTWRVLVINSGSSSIKAKVFADSEENPVAVWESSLAQIGAADLPDHACALDRLFRDLGEEMGLGGLAGVGHRVVHGGDIFSVPVAITPETLRLLRTLIPLAPHHQPHNLAGITAVSELCPNLPQVACFDTAFHATLPPEARELGLPAGYAARGLRRYGFHGLSYQSLVDSFEARTGEPLPSRLIALHLGNGASLCAIENGKSVATSMGFSTLDGIPMGTRSGSVDPGALIHLMREDGLDVDGLEELLYNRCGLLGLSDLSADMKALLDAETPGAKRALDIYTYRIAREVGSMAAALGGVDALSFTGGIGERAALVRAMILERCAWLGLSLDHGANDRHGPRISDCGPVSAWVVPTAEEHVIARQTQRVVALQVLA